MDFEKFGRWFPNGFGNGKPATKLSPPDHHVVENVAELRYSSMKSEAKSTTMMAVRPSEKIYDYNRPSKLMGRPKRAGITCVFFDV